MITVFEKNKLSIITIYLIILISSTKVLKNTIDHILNIN